MRLFSVPGIGVRFILLAALVAALNLSARPRQVTRDWSELQESFQSDPHTPLKTRLAYTRLQHLANAMPWRSDLWHAAGIYALWAGDQASGLACLRRINFQGLSASEWLAVGDAYAQLHQPDQAESAWRRSITLLESAAAYQRLYDLHSQQADPQAILDDLQALSRLKPDDRQIAYQLAVRLAAQDPQEALDWISQLEPGRDSLHEKLDRLALKLKIATLADSPAVQFMVAGQGLADLAEWELAKAAFQRSTQLEPGYAEAWAFLGETRQRVEPPEPGAALEDLRTALKLDPRSVSVVSMLALYWQRQGDYRRAQELFQTAADLEPENPAWYAAQGGLAGIQGKLAEAESYFRQALDRAPQQAAYYNLLVNFYLVNQVQEKALPAALRSVEIDPANPESLTILGQVYLLLDDQAQAVQYLQAALSEDSEYAKAHYILGMAYVFQGQGDLAHAHLLQAQEHAADRSVQEQVQRALQYYFP